MRTLRNGLALIFMIALGLVAGTFVALLATVGHASAAPFDSPSSNGNNGNAATGSGTSVHQTIATSRGPIKLSATVTLHPVCFNVSVQTPAGSANAADGSAACAGRKTVSASPQHLTSAGTKPADVGTSSDFSGTTTDHARGASSDAGTRDAGTGTTANAASTSSSTSSGQSAVNTTNVAPGAKGSDDSPATSTAAATTTANGSTSSSSPASDASRGDSGKPVYGSDQSGSSSGLASNASSGTTSDQPSGKPAGSPGAPTSTGATTSVNTPEVKGSGGATDNSSSSTDSHVTDSHATGTTTSPTPGTCSGSSAGEQTGGSTSTTAGSEHEQAAQETPNATTQPCAGTAPSGTSPSSDQSPATGVAICTFTSPVGKTATGLASGVTPSASTKTGSCGATHSSGSTHATHAHSSGYARVKSLGAPVYWTTGEFRPATSQSAWSSGWDWSAFVAPPPPATHAHAGGTTLDSASDSRQAPANGPVDHPSESGASGYSLSSSSSGGSGSSSPGSSAAAVLPSLEFPATAWRVLYAQSFLMPSGLSISLQLPPW